ncbi:hypothetical protein S245_057569, partial [Arachis hypogaea]
VLISATADRNCATLPQICIIPLSRTKHITQVVAAGLNLPFEEVPQCNVSHS